MGGWEEAISGRGGGGGGCGCQPFRRAVDPQPYRALTAAARPVLHDPRPRPPPWLPCGSRNPPPTLSLCSRIVSLSMSYVV